MVYEVCALVATIILGVLGLELALWIHSVRKLTDEARQTIQSLNSHLPAMLEDVQTVTGLARQTVEEVWGTLSEVAAGFEGLCKNPLNLLNVIKEALKRVKELWHEIRG